MIQNDIALLETDSIHLSQSIVPACLDVFGGDRDRAVATGWGRTTHRGGPADTLQKGDDGAPLTILNHRLHCMYTVVGITTAAAGCGVPGLPQLLHQGLPLRALD
ncbi:hypothetical protein MSG28_014431 [Choristoneura fumiferana]|uniref:Uncharacterized protein n=1 Tax=Choristoneura fumiferana TaxID=7141 RepID=A0ACC0JRQ6_CHOFU|nr:hypothetical protein MSG28_014431 [Choristoneura fumiferana]